MSGWCMFSVSLLLCCAAAQGGAENFQEQQKAVISANHMLEQGNWKEAVSLYRQLVDSDGRLAPVRDELDRARILANLALAYRTGSRFDLALQASQRAAKTAPSFSDAYFGVGLALTALGRHREAATSFEQAAVAAKDSPRAGSVEAAEATVMMADALAKSGERAAARAALAALSSGSEEALRSAAAALAALGDEERASELRRRAAAAAAAAASAPGSSSPAPARGQGAGLRREGAALMEGEALMEAGRHALAEGVLRAGVAAAPENFLLRGALALALSAQSKHAEAIGHLEHATRLQSGDAVTWGRLLFARAAACDWRDHAREHRALAAALQRGEDCRSGLKGDCLEPLLALYLGLPPLLATDLSRKACLCVLRSLPPHPPFPLPPVGAGARQVRVAYLSSDFRHHATAYLARSLWAMHQREAVLAGVFMTIEPPEERGGAGYFPFIRDSAHYAQVVGGMTDWEVARRVNEWGAEVVVDMNGWVKGERSAALALRPAPAQLHYMAYLHSMACPYLDWLVADARTSPPDLAPLYAEPLLLLPSSFLITDHRQMAPPHGPPHLPSPLPPAELAAAWRAALNLSVPAGGGGVVVGNLAGAHKVSPGSARAWVHVLQAAPDALLWVQEWGGGEAARNLRASLDAIGLAPRRLLTSRPPPTAYGQVWNSHALALDLHVDTLPYSAVTLAADLLWLARPALTLPGEAMCARVAGSLAVAGGAGWLLARHPADFIALAARLARAPRALAAAKASLLAARATSPLFDTARWVRGWERGLRMAREVRGGGAGAGAARFHLLVADQDPDQPDPSPPPR